MPTQKTPPKGLPTTYCVYGDCPLCGRNEGIINRGRMHYMVCHKHQVRWNIGDNLWDENDWPDCDDVLWMYRDVRPWLRYFAAPRPIFPFGRAIAESASSRRTYRR